MDCHVTTNCTSFKVHTRSVGQGGPTTTREWVLYPDLGFLKDELNKFLDFPVSRLSVGADFSCNLYLWVISTSFSKPLRIPRK